MSDTSRYTMVISWSEEDEAYLVSLPDWDGTAMNPVTQGDTHGDTHVEAVKNGEEAVDGLVASLTKHGEPLPERKPVATAA